MRVRFDGAAPHRSFRSDAGKTCATVGWRGTVSRSASLLVMLASVTTFSTPLAHADLGHPVPDPLEARFAIASALKGDRLPVLSSKETEASQPASLPHMIDFAQVFGWFEEPVTQRNPLLDFGPVRVPRDLVETFVRAAFVSGVDPVYLMAVADKESSFLPTARAGTSSAEGLFQFIERTWLECVKAYGARYGLAKQADTIEIEGNRLLIGDAQERQRILDLRRDPFLSAVMAAELSKRNAAILAEQTGRRPTPSESYLAHFLGVDGATRFMERLASQPDQSASGEFREAAAANRALFYKTVEKTRTQKKGKRKVHRKTRILVGQSYSEVFDRIDGMIGRRVNRYGTLMERAGPISAFAPVN